MICAKFGFGSLFRDLTWPVIVNLFVNPLMATLKPHSNGPLYSNTVIDTLAVDGWLVTFGTTRLRPRPVPSSRYQM